MKRRLARARSYASGSSSPSRLFMTGARDLRGRLTERPVRAKTALYVYFDDVSGLVVGAAVRLAGLDVGVVSSIEFPKELDRVPGARRRCRSRASTCARDPRATRTALIDSKGLLGDKIINITLGTPKSPQLKDGDVLATRKPSPSFERAGGQARQGDALVSPRLDPIGVAGEPSGQDRTSARIRSSTANILREVERGRGFAHRGFYDPDYARRDGGAAAGQRAAASRQLSKPRPRASTPRWPRSSTATAWLHELDLRRRRASETMPSCAARLPARRRSRARCATARACCTTLDLRPRVARAQLAELNQAAARTQPHHRPRSRRASGTIGGLLVDPSIYEDLKTILGNVEAQRAAQGADPLHDQRGRHRAPRRLQVEALDPAASEHRARRRRLTRRAQLESDRVNVHSALGLSAVFALPSRSAPTRGSRRASWSAPGARAGARARATSPMPRPIDARLLRLLGQVALLQDVALALRQVRIAHAHRVHRPLALLGLGDERLGRRLVRDESIARPSGSKPHGMSRPDSAASISSTSRTPTPSIFGDGLGIGPLTGRLRDLALRAAQVGEQLAAVSRGRRAHDAAIEDGVAPHVRADPPRCVRREAHAAIGIVASRGFDQAEHAFADRDRRAASPYGAELVRNREHEAQMRFEQPFEARAGTGARFPRQRSSSSALSIGARLAA